MLATKTGTAEKPASSTPTNRGLDFTEMLSEITRSRKSNPMKAFLEHINKPGLISLGGVIKPGTRAHDEEKLNEYTEISVKKSVEDGSKVESLNSLLQYGPSTGVKSLSHYFSHHMRRYHTPQYSNMESIMSVGSTDALNKVAALFLTRGDPVVVCQWTYPAVIETFAGAGYKMVSVGMDNEGMNPEALDRVCTEWTGPQKLKVVYLIPTGQNPTGATMSVQRRKDIYSVCQKHNLMIIEDDPYYFIQFGGLPVVHHEEQSESYFSKLPGVENLLPSLLSLDVDGRVVRMDTFSKLITPNTRIGWITGQDYFIDAILKSTESTVQQASGFSQGLISKLLNDEWKDAGFEEHIRFLQVDYISKRNCMLNAMEKYLGNKAVSVVVPDSGMFIWMEINLPEPHKSTPGIADIIFNKLIENNILLVSGWQCHTSQDTEPVKNYPYFRLAYSFATIEQIDSGIQRVANTLKEFGCDL
ncbi:Aromatic amino acid aminotransferase [Zancudomyces culisetae]|uniref:Aromatic amino acid aminotransferase n=1 Tax=Zancudomyces culisetae TaxID=1213189 RepID=A0A1R1PS39_ZANCU|nr:Aromatic amino acid aminotransferase [Zancudomyces culisetae]|eukprot:OMH83800.1 Aromatic amino acid aminotransferase [Zancudomyces culisetae]